MKAYAQVRNQRTQTGVVQQNTSVTQNTSAPASTSANILFAVLVVVAIIWLGVTAVLVYHWNRYSFGDRGVMLGQVVYFAITLLLLMIALFSIS